MNNKNLWAQRSVGIKLWSFDADPYGLSKSLNVLSSPSAKGEPHGTKNTFKENQLHILKLIDEDSRWGEALMELISELGGVKEVLKLIESVQPKSYFIVINIPTSDAWSGNGNYFSKETISVLHNLNTSISFNYFESKA